MNWGSRVFYELDLNGNRINSSRINGSHYVDYQDCQYVREFWMLCGGMNNFDYPNPKVGKFAMGGIDLIDLRTAKAIHQIPIMIHAGGPKPDPTIVMTRNPMYAEVQNGQLIFYFMPEDNDSFIYVYKPM
jgi:hypothetical protein